jgi:hypothetical protein
VITRFGPRSADLDRGCLGASLQVPLDLHRLAMVMACAAVRDEQMVFTILSGTPTCHRCANAYGNGKPQRSPPCSGLDSPIGCRSEILRR